MLQLKHNMIIKTNQGIVVTDIDKKDIELVLGRKWSFHKGYLTTNIRIKGKNYTQQLARFLLNPPKGLEVDHINRDKLDNRRCNLRVVDHKTNLLNRDLTNIRNPVKKYIEGKYKSINESYRNQHYINF